MAETEITQCPECGTFVNMHTAVNADKYIAPEEGDISLCFTCGSINCFDEDIQLRKATDEEISDITPDNMETIRKVQEFINEKNNGR